MATWYTSSVKYAAVAIWTALTATIVGDFRRQTAPTDANARVFRCSAITTGITGAAEPSWNVSQNATTTDAGVTWTEVTGQGIYGWSAPFLRLNQMDAWSNVGLPDTPLYVGSDHAYTGTVAVTFAPNTTAIGKSVSVLSVNTAGSVPPVAADILAGATETNTGNTAISISGTGYYFGMNFIAGSGASGAANINIGNVWNGSMVLDTCKFTIATTSTTTRLVVGAAGTNPNAVDFLNPTFKFGAIGQAIQPISVRMRWVGGSVDGAGSIPTNLFKATSNTGSFVDVIGADLSALGSNTIVGVSTNSDIYNFRNCKLGASYVAYAGTAGTAYGGPEVNIIECSSGALNYIDERHNFVGDKTTSATIFRNGGASDGVTPRSWKVITGAKALYAFPFKCFTREIYNTRTNIAITLRVEIENDGTTFTDADIWIDVDYMGSSATPVSTRVSSKAATILTAGTNIPTSGAVWTTTGQGAPVKQYLQVSFTPQMQGPIYYTVNIAKPSATVFVDPMATLG